LRQRQRERERERGERKASECGRGGRETEREKKE
jgi:hypothetical protein